MSILPVIGLLLARRENRGHHPMAEFFRRIRIDRWCRLGQAGLFVPKAETGLLRKGGHPRLECLSVLFIEEPECIKVHVFETLDQVGNPLRRAMTVAAEIVGFRVHGSSSSTQFRHGPLTSGLAGSFGCRTEARTGTALPIRLALNLGSRSCRPQLAFAENSGVILPHAYRSLQDQCACDAPKCPKIRELSPREAGNHLVYSYFSSIY